HPQDRVVIAKAARRLFDVGFQVKNSIAVARQPVAGQSLEFRKQERPRLAFRAKQYLGVQFLKQRLVACQEAPVQHRQMEFSIVLFYAPALFHRASRRTHAETKIPQRTREFRDQRAKLGFRLLVAKQKQKIEVGIREKHFTTVAAQRQQAQPLARTVSHPQQFREYLLDDFVRQFTQLPKRILRTCAVVKKLPDAFPLGLTMRTQQGKRGDRFFHCSARAKDGVQTWARRRHRKLRERLRRVPRCESGSLPRSGIGISYRLRFSLSWRFSEWFRPCGSPG